MPYPIEEKFVIAIASSALFSLGEADQIHKILGEEAYRQYQEEHINEVLGKGVAFSFVRRLLKLNDRLPDQRPIEVILLSRNSPETGLRVFNSIKAHGLDITRAAFFSGGSPYPYIPAYGATIFLSTNANDVRGAIEAGYPAGLVLDSAVPDDDSEDLRLAFDFDGVVADDAAEQVFKASNLAGFHASEVAQRWQPMGPGPLKTMLEKLSRIQNLERIKAQSDPKYRKALRTAIVTARNAPSHERVITTLKSWGITVDEAFFMGGIEKKRVLEIMKPHLFFDDQLTHLTSDRVPMVHIPFGVANRTS